MFKILIIAVVIIVLGTIFAAVNFLSPKTASTNSSNESGIASSQTEATSSGGLLEQIKNVTSTSEPKEVPKISLEAHVNLLETTVSVLQKRLDILEKAQGIKPATSSTPTSTATTVTTIPMYIPLGSGGVTSDPFYVSLDMFQISLDPAEFPGYTSIQLEVNYKSDQNNGPTYIRLYNSTDASAVTSSEGSGTSNVYTLITSPKFNLATGRKTYVLQAKNNSNTQTYLQLARLKVNF